MAELTVSQLIKIIIGIFVVVVVVIGLYLFFRGYIIDFFKNLSGEESEEEKVNDIQIEQKSESEESLESEIFLRSCEDCGAGLFNICDEKECFEINNELVPFGKRCQFKDGFFIFNKCITLNS